MSFLSKIPLSVFLLLPSSAVQTDINLQLHSAKGVPDFWLMAMKTNEILAEEVGNVGHCF